MSTCRARTGSLAGRALDAPQRRGEDGRRRPHRRPGDRRRWHRSSGGSATPHAAPSRTRAVESQRDQSPRVAEIALNARLARRRRALPVRSVPGPLHAGCRDVRDLRLAGWLRVRFRLGSVGVCHDGRPCNARGTARRRNFLPISPDLRASDTTPHGLVEPSCALRSCPGRAVNRRVVGSSPTRGVLDRA